MDLLSDLPLWYGGGSGRRSSREPLLSLLQREVHQCQVKALQMEGKHGVILGCPINTAQNPDIQPDVTAADRLHL